MGIATKHQRRPQDDMRYAACGKCVIRAKFGGEKGSLRAGTAAGGGNLHDAHRRLVFGGGIERQHRRLLCRRHVICQAIL
ncbi:hypothetical protein D3C87_1963630 [compost metagenome]